MFDTLKYSKILEAIGMSREQAEAQVQIIAEIVEDNLVCKNDLRIEMLGLRSEMERLEHRLVLKLGAIVVTSVTVATAIAVALSKTT